MLNFDNLWLVRSYPETNNRLPEFLEDNIIAIGWSNLPDLTGADKASITAELSTHDYSTNNVTIGVINHFVNNIQVGDLCLIPCGDVIYMAKVKSSYYYDDSKKDDGYPHQRKVEFINKDNPIARASLPEDVQRSLGAQNTVANLKHRIDQFRTFLSGAEPTNRNIGLQESLEELLPMALENIRTAINSDDIQRRFNASVEVLRLLQRYE